MLPLDDPDKLSRRLTLSEQRALRSMTTLHDAIVAGHTVADVIIQDEFTHDVIIDLGQRPDEGACWAVYDAT